MDHYCPIVLTTIGFQNHSMFTLLTIYHVLGIGLGFFGFLHWTYYHFVAFFHYLSFPQRISIGIFLFFDATAVLSLFSFNLYTAFYHIEFCITNTTTIDWFDSEQIKRNRRHDQNIVTNSMASGLWNYGILHSLHNIGLGGIFFWLPKRHDDEYEGYYYPRKDKRGEWQPHERCVNSWYMRDGKYVESSNKVEIMAEAIEVTKGYTLMFPDNVQILVE